MLVVTTNKSANITMSYFLLLSLLAGALLVVPSAAVGGFLGGLEPVKVDEKGVVRAADFAVEELDKISNSLFARKVTDIKSAKRQVVQGWMYYLTIELTETNCKLTQGPAKDLDSCDINDEAKRQLCTVKVYEFMEVSKLIEDTCSKSQTMKTL